MPRSRFAALAALCPVLALAGCPALTSERLGAIGGAVATLCRDVKGAAKQTICRDATGATVTIGAALLAGTAK